MNTLLQIGLSNAVMAIPLAMLAALVTIWKLRPALAHGLWLLVLVKLVTPPLVGIPIRFAEDRRQERSAATMLPVGLDTSERTDQPIIDSKIAWKSEGAEDSESADRSIAAALHAQTSSVAEPRAERDVAGPTVPVNPSSDVSTGAIEQIPDRWSATTLPSALSAVAVVWFAGSLIWFVVTGVLTWRFCRLLAVARPASGELKHEVRRIAQRLGRARCPSIYVVSAPISPLVWPIGRRARILFPEGMLARLTPEERSTVLTHELAHVLRRDHWVRLLELLATGLYWWHPVVWWTRSQLRRVEDECCDVRVMMTWPKLAADYTAALLTTIDFVSEAAERKAAVPPVTSGLGTVRLLQRRLAMISRKDRPAGLGRGGRVVLLLVAACLLPLALGRAAIAVLPAFGSDAPETSVDGAAEASAQSLPARTSSDDAEPEGRREPAAAGPSADRLQEMWEELGCEDPVEARQTVRSLKAAREKSVSFLAKMLEPPKVDDASLDRLIRELDDSEFKVRRKALEQLVRIGRVAEEKLRDAVKKTKSGEVRYSAGLLLEACEKPLYTTKSTRQKVRAIWALEAIGDATARQVLEQLAAGDSRCPTVGLAIAALARLDGRPERAGDYAPKLRYEAKPKETSIPCNGKMVFQTRLVNEGKAPAVVFWGDYAYEDMYRFTVTRKDGLEIPSPRRRLTPPSGTVREKYFHEIPPGESISYNVHLSYSPGSSSQRYYFRLPGIYTVQPSFSATITESLAAGPGQDGEIPGAWTGDLEAEPATITIEGDPNIESECFQLSGQVVDPDGKPVVGAFVVAQRRRTSPSSFDGYALSNVQQTRTDAEGRYSLLGLPLDSPLFFVVVTHTQWPGARKTVTMTPPKKRYETKIVLPQGVTLRGEAVDASGKPLAGVRVDCRGKRGWTDGNGRFVLEGVSKREDEDEDEFGISFWKRDSISRTVYVPREQAIGKSCRIKVLPMDELTAAGRAVFTDGSPAANLTLDFHIPGKLDWVRQAKTDRDGRFSVELPEPRVFKGHVDAIGPGESHLPRRRWCTKIDAIKPGQSDLRLVFDNRARIHVTVKPANALPTSLHFDVTCEMSKLSRGLATIATETLFFEGGEIDLENLAPGKYRLTVRVKEAGHWNWSREVVVGEGAEERLVEVEFKLPTMEFGNVKALVLQPDGKTPVPRGRIWFDSSKSHGGVQFSNGKVELKDIPIGRIRLETTVDGMAQQSVVGTVTANQTTDLGQIVVKRLEDAAGWVEGRVLYDDGTPALGTELGSDGPIGGATAVGAEGAYRIQLMVGENAVDFKLSLAPGWPASAAFTKEYGGLRGLVVRQYDLIVAPVEVKAGKTISHDVVLRRKPLRKLTLNWNGDPEEKLFIGVIVDMKNYRQIRRFPFARVEGEQIELAHLGSGPAMVSVFAEDFFGYREIGAGVDDAAVTFDPDKAGFIEVQTVCPDGTPPERVWVNAKPASLTPIGPVRGLRSHRSMFNMVRSLIQPSGQTSAEQKTSVRAACSPGRYVLTAQANPATAQTVEVKSGQTTKVTFVVENH